MNNISRSNIAAVYQAERMDVCREQLVPFQVLKAVLEKPFSLASFS